MSTAPVYTSVFPFSPSAVLRLWISKTSSRPPFGPLDHFLRSIFRLLSTGVQKEQAAPSQIAVNVQPHRSITMKRLKSNNGNTKYHPIITKVIFKKIIVLFQLHCKLQL